VLKGFLMLAGLVAAGFAARRLGAGLLASATPDATGAAVLVGAGALLTAAGMPRQAVAFAGGYAFGAWRGGALALVAQMLGCLVDFWWSRAVARDWVTRRIARRLARLDRLLTGHPFTATLTLRLLPVGNNLVLNLLAGVSGLRAGPFLAATLIGYLPQTAVFALAGSGVHVDHSMQLAVAGALLVGSGVLGWVLLVRTRVN
jgi:uncharacterized membrane protein YdjX (TVP38/TMEM64 family)